MARNKPRPIEYRRKREQKTDYLKRRHLLLSGKPRVVVRLTNQRIIAQLIEFAPTGDHVVLGLDSSSLRKLGWEYAGNNLPAAYLTGLLLGRKAQEKGIQEAILDTGLQTPLKRGRIYAFLKGVLDSGFVIPHSDNNIFPTEERLSGKHIQGYAETLKNNDKTTYERKFAKYLKRNADPEKIADQFTNVKQKIMAGKKNE